MNEQQLEQSVAESLRQAGVSVPNGCDSSTLARLVTEAMTGKRSPRDSIVAPHITLLETLLESHAAMPQRAALGSATYRLKRQQADSASKIDAAEDALVEALVDAYPGCVFFNRSHVARPRREALLELARELRSRDARGELPVVAANK